MHAMSPKQVEKAFFKSIEFDKKTDFFRVSLKLGNSHKSWKGIFQKIEFDEKDIVNVCHIRHAARYN